MQLYLDFYNHSIVVSDAEESLLQKLKDEFHFFVREHLPQIDTTISINKAPSPEIPSLIASKLLENATIYKLGTRQYVDYFGEALTIWDKTEKRIEIYSENDERLFELSFLAIHSILGQELDRDGFCRVHALAISLNRSNAVVMLPSKGGKSTLLTHLLENPEVKIISDDMPLVDYQGRIHPFPSKMSLNQPPKEGILSQLTWHEFKRFHYPTKWTASLAQMNERIEKHSMLFPNILIAGYRLSHGQSLLTEVSKWKMIIPMMEHMIVGMGLPQIIELFLNFNFVDLIKLPYHALIRSYCAFQLVRKSKCFYLYLGPDRAYNAQLILDLMYEQQN